MREIKFRFWGEETQQYYEVYEIVKTRKGLSVRVIGGKGFQYTNTIQAAEIEQFTGIQDSEGVDVYENDYIRYTILNDDDVYTGLIVWGPRLVVGEDWAIPIYSHGFAVKFLDDSGYTCFPDEFKIVGNIHQHPHLLEE